MKKLFILFLAIFSLLGNAQNRCGTKAYTNALMKKYPEYEEARKKVNTETRNWIANYNITKLPEIISIPVVVHIVWNTAAENISDSRVFEQIEILNNDYRRTNIDVINTPSVWQGIAADCEIEFCLATIDPNGNTTSGITRTETTVSQFAIWGGASVEDASDGGKDAWPNDDYLNIWVCDLGNGLLGYASPPSSWSNSDDGVVINYRNFGLSGNANQPYHKGRTATHEVGHWLNLDHIWGDNNCGNDNVTDTPVQEEENYGCPGFSHNTNSCGTTNNNGDMFMNYMDYTNDACMNLFTQGQKTRMISAINQYRSNHLNQTNCNGPTSIINIPNKSRELIKVIDILGRVILKPKTNTHLFYIYDNGSVEKKIILN